MLVLSTKQTQKHAYLHALHICTNWGFVHLSQRNVVIGETVPVLIKHNNLGCGCLAGD